MAFIMWIKLGSPWFDSDHLVQFFSGEPPILLSALRKNQMKEKKLVLAMLRLMKTGLNC